MRTGAPAARWPSVLLALLAAAWALFLLPAQHVAWEALPQYPAPGWARALESSPVYDWLRAAGALVGWADDYLLFGAASGISLVLLAFAMRGVTPGLGAVGAGMFWVTLACAPAVLVSYLARDWPEPFGLLWGIEPILLIAIGVCAAVCAAVAVRRGARPWWAVVLLGLMLVWFFAGAVVFGYYPHGSLVIGGVALAVAAAGWRPPAER